MKRALLITAWTFGGFVVGNFVGVSTPARARMPATFVAYWDFSLPAPSVASRVVVEVEDGPAAFLNAKNAS
jgi:hypothetical protein